MKINENIEKTVINLKDFSEKYGMNFGIEGNVKPELSSKYSVKFMGEVPYNIYESNIIDVFLKDGQEYITFVNEENNEQTVKIEKFINNEIRVALATRLDSLKNAGKSNRHSTTFMMLGFEGIKTKKEGIELHLDFIENFLDGVDYDLELNINPQDNKVKEFLDKKGIKYNLDSECYFDGKSKGNDRYGKRIEFNISFKDKNGKKHKWEILNLLFIEKFGDNEIKGEKFIMESGGSFERLITIKNGESNINKVWTLDEYKKYFPDLEENALFGLIDITQTLVNMSLSGYRIGRKDQPSRAFTDSINYFASFLIDNKLENNISLYKLVIDIKNNLNKTFYETNNNQNNLREGINLVKKSLLNYKILNTYLELIYKEYPGITEKEKEKNKTLLENEELFYQSLIILMKKKGTTNLIIEKSFKNKYTLNEINNIIENYYNGDKSKKIDNTINYLNNLSFIKKNGNIENFIKKREKFMKKR